MPAPCAPPAAAAALRPLWCLLAQVETHLSHAPLATRKLARCLAVFLLSYSTAYMETLTISHVSARRRARAALLAACLPVYLSATTHQFCANAAPPLHHSVTAA